MYVDLDVFGDRQLQRQILRWGEHAEDASPAFRSIMARWMRGTTKQFQSQGARASGGWAPISKDWRQYKATHGFDTRILHMTGKLRRSITQTGAPHAIQRIAPQELRWGTDVPYAPFHQHGATEIRNSAWGKPTKSYRWSLARRRPVELTDGPRGDRATSVKILQLFIARGKVIR